MSQNEALLFKKWLREQFIRLVNVQRCTLGQSSLTGAAVREVDLMVTTWGGNVLHVHLIDEPIKPNRVRKIIETATESGIPVLFLLDAALLPMQGERIQGEAWFVPFQALVNDRAYAYRADPAAPRILPVQFKPISRQEYQTAYGAPIAITQVRHFRATVKHSALKGFWLLVDLESEAATQMPPIRNTDTSGYQTSGPRFADAGMPHWERPAHQKPPGTAPAVKTRLDLCYEMLGVERSASREEVKAAFRRLAFEVHPDVSELPKDEAELRFKRLSEAYEVIKAAQKWT